MLKRTAVNRAETEQDRNNRPKRHKVAGKSGAKERSQEISEFIKP